MTRIASLSCGPLQVLCRERSYFRQQLWVRNRTGPHIGRKSDQTLSAFNCTSISQIFMNKLFI